MLKTLAAAFALALAGGASAQALTPEQIVQRHMDFAAKGDLDGIANDYAEDAVSITANATTQGREAIRAFYANMLKPRPGPAAGAGGSAPAPGGAPAMKPTRVWSEGNVGYVTWEMGPVKGKEAFVVKDGKIQTQVVFISGGPPAGGAAR